MKRLLVLGLLASSSAFAECGQASFPTPHLLEPWVRAEVKLPPDSDGPRTRALLIGPLSPRAPNINYIAH